MSEIQTTKTTFGKIPAQIPEDQPWNTLQVDTIGPYTVKTLKQKSSKGKPEVVEKIILQCCTMIDPVTRWFEIARIKNKEADTVATVVDRTWLCRYPRPVKCIHDGGPEFIGTGFQELLISYGIQSAPTTAKNPQANAVLERVHQVLANMLRTFQLLGYSIDQLKDGDIFDGALANVAFAIRATYHTELKASPAAVVFQREMMFPTLYVANWPNIQARKQAKMLRDNARENKKRQEYDYQVGDWVLIRRGGDGDLIPKLARPTQGPYKIIKCFTNGTVRIRRGGYRQRINIRRLIPYHHQQVPEQVNHCEYHPQKRCVIHKQQMHDYTKM